MLDRKGTIRKGNGLERDSRFDHKLLNDAFNIDQRSMQDLLAYLINFSKQINYYNSDNEIDGKWNALLKNDPTFCMVEIISESLDGIDNLILKRKKGEEDFLESLLVLHEWQKKIEQWYEVLFESGHQKIANEIVNMLKDGLGDHFTFIENALKKWTSTLAKEDVEHFSYLISSYHNAFNEEQKKQYQYFARDFRIRNPELSKKGSSFQRKLSKSITLSRSVIERFQNFVRTQLEKQLYSTDDHEPHVALYITFSLLFRKAQNKINTLSKRHLDFFYKEILKQTAFKGVASQVVVAFDLVNGIDHSIIPKGSELTAGKLFGTKEEVFFKTQKVLDLYAVQLEELHTLLFHSNKYIYSGTKKPLVSQVLKNSLLSNGKPIENKDKWYAFGANKQTEQRTIINEKKTGHIGFIVGSPVLFLQEGQRTIQIDINFEASSFKSHLYKLIQQIKEARKVPLERVVYDLFSEGFYVFYTTANSWEKFENYEVELNPQTCTMTLFLKLQSKDPVFTVCAEEKNHLKWPSVKIILNEFAPYYLYSFFQISVLESIHLKVTVERLRNLSLYNNIGKMPTDKPFDLFGPLAETGSFLMFGNSELFQKKLNHLDIVIDWDNLPETDGGFDTYYQGYIQPITNDEAKVNFSILSNSYWLPTNNKDEPQKNLFSVHKTINKAGFDIQRLNPQTQITIKDLSRFGYTYDHNLKDPLVYNVATQTGFFRLKLAMPTGDFGLNSYQETVKQIATYNATHQTNLPLPNAPYIPKARQISINYTASDALFFQPSTSRNNKSGINSSELLQITPYGIESVLKDGKVEKQSLFCEFDYEGYLFMGLSGLEKQTTLTLYFDFLNSSTTKVINNINLKWEFYNGFKWCSITKENLLIDETNGFNRSGIIEIILPKVSVQEVKNGKKIYWLRISTPRDSTHFPRIKGIYVNAVRANCVSQNERIIGKEIPENSITKLYGNFPDIKKVHQPTTSIGGIQVEDQEDFYTRVSERIRHKGRAVSIWDYERILLENFDDVSIVKCTNYDKSFNPVPGKVKVIVLSSKWTISERYYFSNEALYNMTSLLKRMSSPLIQVEVINPEVEYLLVNCQVKFKPEFNGGYYIELLNREISEYISPMTNLDIGAGGIGGRIVPNMIMSFIEELNFIDAVEELNIEHITRDSSKDGNYYSLGVYRYGQELRASKPWSVLVPVMKHNILLSKTSPDLEDPLEVGIGNLEIGLDFIIAEDPVENTKLMALDFKKAENPDEGAFLVIKHNSLKNSDGETI